MVPLGVQLSPGLHHAVALLSRATGKTGAVAERAEVRRWSRKHALRRLLAEVGPLDAMLAMGTEMYDLAAVRSAQVPTATYDDATLAQMWHHPSSDIRSSGFPSREVHKWFAYQAASSRAADVCCASTRWAASSLVEDCGVAADRVKVVGIGHRPRPLANPAERDWSAPRFLFVGVDWSRKNGAAVVRAFGELLGSVPSATLDVVGLHPAMEARGIRFHGLLSRQDPRAQATLDALFARATAFVLPSRFEPAGIAYLEAASAGLPVIVTTEGGAVEMLHDAAIAVHPDDSPALVAAMRKLCDPDVARDLGGQAARRASNAAWPHVAALILGALRL